MGTESNPERGTSRAGDELDHFSRPATRRARSGLLWVPSNARSGDKEVVSST
jgi:hypothetical protein